MNCPNCNSDLIEYHAEDDMLTCSICGWLWTDKIDCLSGFPNCPFCGRQLNLRPMPGAGETYWFCSDCGANLSTAEVISGLNLLRVANHLERR